MHSRLLDIRPLSHRARARPTSMARRCDHLRARHTRVHDADSREWLRAIARAHQRTACSSDAPPSPRPTLAIRGRSIRPRQSAALHHGSVCALESIRHVLRAILQRVVHVQSRAIAELLPLLRSRAWRAHHRRVVGARHRHRSRRCRAASLESAAAYRSAAQGCRCQTSAA